MDGGGRRREARTLLEDWLLFVDSAGHLGSPLASAGHLKAVGQ
jgi:hypothetical protein